MIPNTLLGLELTNNHPDTNFDSFMALIEHFSDANLPEDVSVSVDTASTTDMEPDFQALQQDTISDNLPGSTPSCKDDMGRESVRRTLDMETPVTTEKLHHLLA